jgi:hypothetical protein
MQGTTAKAWSRSPKHFSDELANGLDPEGV